ncbi:MAG: FG-GAP repeat protein [Myxococcales bacterium]|nr:FG-GAP repeat protein [Myxococcales bacterium]
MGTVTFPVGISQAATVTDAAGNTGALKSPCPVTVGDPPIVTWVAPSSSTQLNAATDGGAAAGWQGTLTVQTDVGGSGGTVTFEIDCGGTITTLGNANIDGAGVATLANATIPECASAKITAKTSNITGKGVGSATLTKVVDTIVPAVPTGLTATVKDRRQTSFTLGWTAPADGGQSVSGYAVRVSKAPITAGNFDAAEPVAFTGSPKAPGGAESLDVGDRHIENDYYFAVAASDAAGNRSSIISAGPAKATFNSTILPGAASETFGFAIDGGSSINGDTLADLLVGARVGNLARAYFGKSGGFATTPDIEFTGVSGSRFGFSARVVGDIDADGLSDIAIGAPLESSRGRVYIFKGRANWPATLDVTQADYVIDVDTVADANFVNSQFGVSIAPLGDFNGDGAADFAVGASVYQGGRGYVAVILGVPSGAFPAAVTLPTAVGTRALAFLGDSAIASGNFFGGAVTGLAAYFTGGIPALVVGANGSLAGRVYAFKGGASVKTTNQVSDGETYVGSSALRTGGVLNNLGSIAGLPTLGVGSPSTSAATGGDARLFFGNSTGVFAGSMTTFTNSAATGAGDQFGSAVFGGGFSGSTVNVSLINGAGPDVAFSSIKLGGASPPKLYFIDGAKATTSGDVATVADVVYTLPAGWLGAGTLSGPVRDSNGDGYAEIAIAEMPALVAPAYAGRVLVLW